MIKQGEKHSWSLCDSKSKPTTASDWKTELDAVNQSFPPPPPHPLCFELFSFFPFFPFFFYFFKFPLFFIFFPISFFLSLASTFFLISFSLSSFFSLFYHCFKPDVKSSDLSREKKFFFGVKCTTYAVLFDIWDQYKKINRLSRPLPLNVAPSIWNYQPCFSRTGWDPGSASSAHSEDTSKYRVLHRQAEE